MTTYYCYESRKRDERVFNEGYYRVTKEGYLWSLFYQGRFIRSVISKEAMMGFLKSKFHKVEVIALENTAGCADGSISTINHSLHKD